ncbi:SDR family oxidoreductase [Qipengyuania sp. GH25]|uniref:SDR family oxidoreductase n=1 Tax=Qipengyuania pacifica TaxID=2860199 RepID=A0ABS7JIB7_9SPHN|nr:SDR family oxidoreductase [Qipengyuania aerophila]MBX7488574.1 SDR family oxidoreductase [Qipengyuania aerophila]
MQTSGNTILITGGGSGIGRELARKWHDLGNTVIVAGRTRASLDETAAGHDNIHTMIVDVGDAEDIARFAKKVVEVHPAINVLVNNAGIMRFEDITEERELGDAEATIATNLLGPIRLIDGLIEHLKAQENAAIINVTSGLAFVPMPRTATYSATKAAMHSYTVSLRAKLEGKIEVIELAPPAVQTELTPGQSTREGYMPLDQFIEETMLGFTAEETPQEVLTQNVLFLRNAEAEGRFDKALEMTSKF